MLYKLSLRVYMEFANYLWSPFWQIDVKKSEMVQMRATRMVKQLQNYLYEVKMKIY